MPKPGLPTYVLYVLTYGKFCRGEGMLSPHARKSSRLGSLVPGAHLEPFWWEKNKIVEHFLRKGNRSSCTVRFTSIGIPVPGNREFYLAPS
jgi:hypothetical protein